MSYGFNVRKVGDELVLENHKAAAAHIPDGAVFTVSGHEPKPDTSKVASLNVSLAVHVEGQPYPQAAATYNTAR